MNELKKCAKCGTFKPTSSFSKCSSNKDGLQKRCKECVHNHYEIHKEQIIARVRQYSKDNKQKISDRNRKKRRENPELVAERKRRDYLKHHDKRIASNQKYHRAPEDLAAYSRKNHRKRADPSCVHECTLTSEEFAHIIESQENKCACCGRTFSENLKPERDCIKPLSAGGALEPWNVQALCSLCNLTKRSMEIRFIKINGERWWFAIKRFSKIVTLLQNNGATDASEKVLQMRKAPLAADKAGQITYPIQ